MDQETLKAHGLGVDALGNAASLPESLATLGNEISGQLERVPDRLIIALGKVALAYQARERDAAESEKRYRAIALDLDAMAGAFTINEHALKALAGSPFPHARKAATFAAIAAGGHRIAENARGYVDSVLGLHDAAVRSAGEARQATQDLHATRSALRACEAAEVAANAGLEAAEAELAECREALADWKAKAERAERQLAEYRALLAAMPYGAARAYPAAHSLMRAYLSDLESS